MDRFTGFGSDNYAPVHDDVLRMLAAANSGSAVAYGDDPWTHRATGELAGVFGARGGVFFVLTGTAANILGLSLLLRPYQGVICAQSAHLNVDECGALERIAGNKILSVPAPDGKLTPELIATRLGDQGDEHRVQAGAVAITQVTELGTCYSLRELEVIGEFCRAEGLRLYIDGARLANAAAHLGCGLAELACQADVLSFGGTKNGALGAEAVIVMREGLADSAPFLRKQQMQLFSKMRYLAAQFLALLEGQLWLGNARHANAMASRLAERLSDLPELRLWQPVQSNMVFASMPPALIERLQRDWQFYVWDQADHVVRWLTSFATTEAEVDKFTASVRQAAERAG